MIRIPLILVALAAPAPAIDAVFTRYQDRVESSVERGLDFLAVAQRADGTFPGRYGDTSGVVSLVGMAFLSKGHLPIGGRHAPTVTACIDYVLDHQQANGLLSPREGGDDAMYSHTISSLFLSELSGMVDAGRQRRIDAALASALRLILDAQAVPKGKRNRGGWRYRPDSTDSDLSASGWALMALRSARLNGAPVPDDAIAAAVGYVKKCFDAETGGFGYRDNTPRDTLTGCGLLCLELTGHHGLPELLRAGDRILATMKSLPGERHEYYANYYNAQAMFQLGGRYWQSYASWMYDHYLPRQRRDGSWNGREGDSYATAMVVLSFSVPYRQLPIYQRDETVDSE